MNDGIDEKTVSGWRPERGAALVVALVLLMILTLLGISGMNTATTELTMAGNNQYLESAFQAAESGVEEALAQGQFRTSGVNAIAAHDINGSDLVSSTTEYQCSTPVPDVAFSIGSGKGIAAFHFRTVATAEATRGARAEHQQNFYIVGPAGATDVCP
ncbi:MAG: PilX N-terminal domain-containing pilus assembly protein [Gammaproteobacteria bacterium]|jgi:type IV pilus assembly protein PilX